MRLAIERMSYGPDAIAHEEDGRVVFVRGGVPGDVVEAEPTHETKGYVRAKVKKVVEASRARVIPVCPYYELCGGCPWAALEASAQLDAKRACVVDSLVRVGRFDAAEAQELVQATERPSEPWGYRNKVELALVRDQGKLSVGFHREDGNGVVRIERCALLPERHAKLPKALGGALSYLSRSQDLGIERAGLRVSERTRDLEVALWTSPGGFPRSLASKVLSDALRPSSIVRVLTKGPRKARRVCGVERLAGKGHWDERVAGGRMSLSAPSFFQVNTIGAERLIELALSLLEPTERDEAMDLYCGAGTFTLPLGRQVAWVSAVESLGTAVRDLRRNLERAGLANVEAVGGDAGREFPDVDADVIVVDPPRAGLSAEVVSLLSGQRARALAYVSCDPATLARDLARFRELGSYAPTRIVPVDLFPQTYHVETVTLLTRSQ